MHPDDIEEREFHERIGRLLEGIEVDRLAIDQARVEMDQLIIRFRDQLPQEYHQYIETLESFLRLFEQIGRNRVKINELASILEMQNRIIKRDIQILSEKIAGFDKER